MEMDEAKDAISVMRVCRGGTKIFKLEYIPGGGGVSQAIRLGPAALALLDEVISEMNDVVYSEIDKKIVVYFPPE